MNITIHITGLEGITQVLQSLVGAAAIQVQQTAPAQQNPVTPVVPAPVVPIQAYPAQAAPAVPVQQAVPVQPAAPVAPAAPIMPQAPAPVQAVPTAAQTYTMDQLAVAATTLMDAGKQTELITLLGQFGVQALTQLPQEQYGNFATSLRALGAKL